MTNDNKTELCLACNKEIQKQYLQRHMRQVHDKIKDHQCDICKMCFVYPSSLQDINQQFMKKK